MANTTTWKSAWAAGLLLVSTMGCTAPNPGVGADRETQTNASLVTWSDGQPAYAISCGLPGSCQTRALAICRSGSYKTLKSENMPSIGTRREDLGPPSVVIRCS